jgi:NodT family efflux transporter outer membrane factor (OMF) lipoprotein
VGIECLVKSSRCVVPGLFALACAACTVGPDPRRPDVDVPQGWAAARDAKISTDLPSRVVAAPASDGRWWSVFNDPVLDGLMASAMAQSLDVQEAGLRIAEARAQRDAATGAYYPSVESSNLGARTRMGAGGIGQALSGGQGAGSSSSSSSSGISTNLFNVGFDATWEPDLFGKTRRSVQAAEAGIRSAEEQRHDAMLSLAAEITRAYLALRGAERTRALTLADIASQEQLQTLIASRNRSGLAPTSDVATQQVQVSGTRAQLPQIEQNITTNRNRLALLLAMPPGALDARLGEGAIPALPPEVPVGLPGDLLRRRPDIRRSEAEAEAAMARIGVARAALYPSVRFAAIGAFSSNETSSLFEWASRFGLVGAQLSIPIFEGGKLQAQLRIADLRSQEAILSYRQTVLAAFHDVDNAMTTYAQDQRRTRDLARQSNDSRRGRELARDRYTSGLGAYIDVLNAEHQANQVELDLAQSTVTASTDLVALFKALGGGWDDAR